MLAWEEVPVCTTSPGKMAEELDTGVPFTDAEPVVYSIAPTGPAVTYSDMSGTNAAHKTFRLQFFIHKLTAEPYLRS